jgi:hypothetical protein
MPNPVRLLCILAVLALGGCSVYPRQFTVETQAGAGREPLIYAPGTMPGESLLILVPDVTMECAWERIDVPPASAARTPKDSGLAVSFELTRRLVDQRDLGSEPTSVYAKFDAANFRKLVDAIATQPQDGGKTPPTIRADLAAGLKAKDKCGLHFRDAQATGDADSVASYTAERILHGLPRAFSSVARIAYNHRMTGGSPSSKNIGNDGFSVDIQAGMRLRLENSLPIAPAGINAADNMHPSSVAAPSYVYFNPITAPQVCATYVYPPPDQKADNEAVQNEQMRAGAHICPNMAADENTVYLSPAAEMLRFGARQVEQIGKLPSVSTGAPVYAHGVDVSNLIDLMERAEPGRGVWRYWRLWSPYNRDTTPAKKLSSTNGGSTDNSRGPILIAANDIQKLDELLVSGLPDNPPCSFAEDDPTHPAVHSNWQCYYFHYRVVPIPEIAVRVNGAERWVPVGTTLHDIVAPMLQSDLIQGDATMGYYRPPATDAARRLAERGRQRFLKQVRIKRMFDGAPYPLRADKLDVAGASSSFLRLQLLAGDDIAW